jgi:hypothetical protein
VALVHDLLELNLGRGHYSYDLFDTAPTVWGDACKGSSYVGGGYFSSCGRYRFWHYGTSAKRKSIAFLEGDTFVFTCGDLMSEWRGCMVNFGEDNQSWLGAGNKGASGVEDFGQLCRVSFAQQVRGGFIVRMFWLPSEENVEADHLSRDREDAFLESVAARDVLLEGAVLRRHPRCGEVRRLPDYSVDVVAGALHQLDDGYSSNNLKDGPRQSGNPRQSSTIVYPRTTIWVGMPAALVARVDNMMDNRLAPSSWRTVKTAYNHWLTVAAQYNWDEIIETDDPARGSKMVAYVCHFVDQTEIVYSSISDYVWGLTRWQGLQHQADPLKGVLFWEEFMSSVKVLTWVPHEPRVEIPFEVVRRLLLGIL